MYYLFNNFIILTSQWIRNIIMFPSASRFIRSLQAKIIEEKIAREKKEELKFKKLKPHKKEREK